MLLDEYAKMIFRLQYGLIRKKSIIEFANRFLSDMIPNNTIALSVNWFVPITEIPNLCDYFCNCYVIKDGNGNIVKTLSRAYIYKNEIGKLEILNKQTYLEKSKVWKNDLANKAFNQRKTKRNINREKALKENENKKIFSDCKHIIKSRKKGHFKKETLKTNFIVNMYGVALNDC